MTVGTARVIPYRTQNVIGILLVGFFLLLAIASSPTISVTLDEPQHFHYGLRLLQGNAARIDDSSMPISVLNVLPYYLGSLLPAGTLRAVLQNTFVARLVTIVFSCAVAALVFRWTRSVYGFMAALFSTSLYVLDPNLLAHSTLITTDVFAAGMIALTFFELWKFANSRKATDGVICALILAFSQLAKYTSLALYPLAFVTLLIHDAPSLWAAWRSGNGRRALCRYVTQLGLYICIVAAVSVIVINIGFLFDRTAVPFKDYRFRSDAFRSLQARLPAVANVPVPFPYPFLEGIDFMVHTNQVADRYGNVYLLGRVSKPKGFPGYYFIASALKMPIATQVFVVAALISYFAIPSRRAGFFRDGVFFLVPFIAFTVYFNFFLNAQNGIRYYMIVFPLLYVFVGSLFADWNHLATSLRVASAVLIGYLAISVLSYFPYFTPYFNEFVWDKTQTYKYLADSNLDWGQSQGALASYLAAHPDAIYEPRSVQPGLIVVGGSDLVGILTSPEEYAWLRNNFKPVGTIAYCYFVYDISPGQIAKLCATTDYCR